MPGLQLQEHGPPVREQQGPGEDLAHAPFCSNARAAFPGSAPFSLGFLLSFSGRSACE